MRLGNERNQRNVEILREMMGRAKLSWLMKTYFFVEKVYSKLGLGKDLFDLSLSYLPRMCQKSSPVFIKGDDDVTILLGY